MFKIQVLTKAKEAVEVEVEVEVKSLQATIKFNENYTNKLKLELALLRCIRFGIKSETLITSQWRLFEELHNIKVAIIEQAIVQLSHSNPTADAQKKNRLYGKTMVAKSCLVIYPALINYSTCSKISANVKKCDSKLVKIGEDTTEKLGVIPAQFIVHQ